jgi:isoleucyl-tRNA synthetase
MSKEKQRKDGPAQQLLGHPGAGYRKVEPWFDVAALEREILSFWNQTEAFTKLVEKNRGKPVFSFLDGPITANNPMGVHHAWGRTLKDAYQRYWAMNGRELRYQNGFDCQGLWVEVEVEKEHGLNSKQDVESFGVANFVEACKARVKKYSGIQTAQSVRLGMWMDWDNSYFTMAEENNYTIWSFLKKCHERGKVYRGTDVMPWSGLTGSAYSQMEIIEGRKLVAHTALFVRFPLRGRDKENLLVWTTTPWTLTCNVAAAVNVDLDYVKLRENRSGELYYFAAENLQFKRLERQFKEKKEWVEGVPKLKTLAQIFNERGGYELEGTVKGAELVGLEYDGPFDELEAQGIPGGFPFGSLGRADGSDEADERPLSGRQAHRVIDGGRDTHGNPVVVAGEGTGIVHIAPGCGDIDHEIGREQGLPALAPLDEAAQFLPPFGFLAGRRATDPTTVEAILQSLRDKGLLVATERYPHVYPHCWRTGDELVFRLVDEWYIKMDWRDEIKKVVDDIRWIPGWGRERELEWLTNMRDWMISKKRFWGLALPIWVCEQCEHFEVIGSYEELKERAVEGWEQFESHTPHRPWIDAVQLACPECGGRARRVEDVGNPWLDAGIVPYSTVHYNDDPEYWKRWIPADLVLECFPGQFRNWFYSLLAMSTMMEGIAPFKTLVGHALVRDEQGKEMHKSTGNAIWFDEAAEQAGADVMRWLYVRQEPATNLNFGFGVLREVRGKFLNTLWNTYSFFTNYARLERFDPEAKPIPFEARPDFDRWILTELQDTIAACRAGFEDYDVRASARAVEAFVDDLSGWYVRHNRRRFWKSADAADTRAALQTLHECLEALIRLVAPHIPFVSEAIYQNLVRGVDADAAESVHHTDYPNAHESRTDRALTEQMRAVKRLTSLALAAREAKKIKVRQPLAMMRIGPRDKTEAEAAVRFREMLLEDLNVKSIEVLAPGSASPLTYQLKPNFKSLGSRLGKRMKAAAAAINAASAELIERWRAGDEQITVQVDGEPIALERADLLLQTSAPDDQTVAEDRGSWVAFDIVLTDELETEGLMRDLLRRLQLLRKESGLEIEDRIVMQWASSSAAIERVFARWTDYMQAELLCPSCSRREALAEGKVLTLDGEKITVSIEKASASENDRDGGRDASHPSQDSAAVDADLLEMLRCPVAVHFKDKGDDPGRLRLVQDAWLVCDDSGLKYPIRNGIPVMLVDEGKRWKDTAEDDLPVPPPAAED